MASCLLCASLQINGSKARFTTRYVAEGHAAQHFNQAKHFDDDCIISLDQVFEQCFPSFTSASSTKRKKVVKKEGRQTLFDLCHALLDGHVSKVSPRVTCQKCGSGIVLYDKKAGRKLRNAMEHASVHLGIDLFECRKCGNSFGSRHAVKHHLGRNHRLRGLSEYYTDKSADFIDEITASIKRCFSDGNGQLQKAAPMISRRNVSCVRCKTNGSDMAVERQLLCYDLLTQLAGDGDKIQCRLCSNRISVKSRGRYRSDRAMEHALVHLKKPLLRCTICSSFRRNRSEMRRHLKSAHALLLPKNYECMADEFHTEITSMLRKCYAVGLDK